MRIFGFDVTRAVPQLASRPSPELLPRSRHIQARILRAWIGALIILYNVNYADRWSRRHMEALGMSQREWQAARTILHNAGQLSRGGRLFRLPLVTATDDVARLCLGYLSEAAKNRNYAPPV